MFTFWWSRPWLLRSCFVLPLGHVGVVVFKPKSYILIILISYESHGFGEVFWGQRPDLCISNVFPNRSHCCTVCVGREWWVPPLEAHKCCSACMGELSCVAWTLSCSKKTCVELSHSHGLSTQLPPLGLWSGVLGWEGNCVVVLVCECHFQWVDSEEGTHHTWSLCWSALNIVVWWHTVCTNCIL